MKNNLDFPENRHIPQKTLAQSESNQSLKSNKASEVSRKSSKSWHDPTQKGHQKDMPVSPKLQ